MRFVAFVSERFVGFSGPIVIERTLSVAWSVPDAGNDRRHPRRQGSRLMRSLRKSCDVYALCEPGTGEIRYIGYSVDARRRFRVHLCENARSYKSRWINKVLRNGLAPTMKILCVVQGAAAAKQLEIALIASHRRLGSRLTNTTAGGDGVADPSPKVREKIAAAARGRRHSAEVRARLSAANRGNVPTAATRAKLSAALKGRVVTAETRAKISASNANPSAETIARMSAAQKGHGTSLAARANISKAQKKRFSSVKERAKLRERANRQWTPEARAVASARYKGRKLSAEVRAKMSASRMGRVVSAETRAKIGAAVRAAAATKRAEKCQ